jgi:peptidyl-dipeptidase Dcp
MAIANNPAKPSFQNTVLALEISGVDLKATGVFII